MLNQEVLAVSGIYMLSSRYGDVSNIRVYLEEIDGSIYKFKKLENIFSDKEVLILDINTYGFDWNCEFIEEV